MSTKRESEDLASYKKLFQFWNVVKRNEHHEALYWAIDREQMNKEFEKIIAHPGDINYQFPSVGCITLREPRLAGCTALHLAVDQKNELTTQILLSQPGIDFTIKNHRGSTALHEAVERYYDNYKHRWRLKGKLENKIVDMILQAHVNNQVSVNPRDKHGITHFHAACMSNNVEAVEFFTGEGVPVNRPIDSDLAVFQAQTPLHIAVGCCAFATVETLLKHGADVNRRDASGMTPIHLLLEQNMTIVDLINSIDDLDTAWKYKVAKLILDVETNKKIMELLLLRSEFDAEDLPRFHAACALQNTSLLEQLLTEIEDINRCAKMDLPFWPGYTALHFAAHFDAQIVKFLLEHGANLESKDASGLTPFNVCLPRYSIEDLHFILSSHSVWKNLVLSDGKTKLLDAVYAMRSFSELDDFFKIHAESYELLRLPRDSPLWPGCTLLHLAVSFTETSRILERTIEYTREEFGELSIDYIKRIKVCLNHGADVTAVDARGTTPLQLAYRLQAAPVVKLFLQEHVRVVNPVDADNLSHLYIACAFNYPGLVKKLLANDDAGVNVKIKSTFEWHRHQKYYVLGNRKEADFYVTHVSTALHVAVTTESRELVETLVAHGADVNAMDANGVTPLHRALACKYPEKTGQLLLSSAKLKERTLHGLNYLHLAAEFNCFDEKLIDRFVELGADVNRAINFEDKSLDGTFVGREKRDLAEPFAYLKRCNGYKPLVVAVHRNNPEVVKALLERGADVFAATRPRGWNLLHSAFCGGWCCDLLLATFKRDVELQKRMEESSGITLLHLACNDCSVFGVNYHLKKCGMDVNARVRLDSPLWPGCTPMHVLALQMGKSADGERKITLIMRQLLENGADVTLTNAEENTPIHLTEIGYDSISYDFYAHFPFTERLLAGLKDFYVNPTNLDGISLFHIACLRSDVEVMKRFLRCSAADANRAIDLYATKKPGCAPLHLVLDPDSPADNDARVRAIHLLVKYGANVNATDLFGNNAFHAAVKCPPPRNKLLQKIFSIGTSINAKNVFGEEPLGILLTSKKLQYEDVKFFMERSCHPNIFEPLRDEGYLSMFLRKDFPMLKKMIKTAGITKLDDLGRNAIHNVVSREYANTKNHYMVITWLTERGCDVNLRDKLDRTPLHLAVKFMNHQGVIGLLRAGADINLTDVHGESPFSYCFSFSKNEQWHQFEYSYRSIYNPMAIHVWKLQIVGLYVSDINRETLAELLKKWPLDEEILSKAKEELSRIKLTEIESICLYDFFSDTRVLDVFSSLPSSRKLAVYDYFKSIEKYNFRRIRQLGYLLKIGFEKTLKRLEV